MNYDSSDMIIDPAPTEVNKNRTIDIQEKLDINRPTKSVGFGFRWRKMQSNKAVNISGWSYILLLAQQTVSFYLDIKSTSDSFLIIAG